MMSTFINKKTGFDDIFQYYQILFLINNISSNLLFTTNSRRQFDIRPASWTRRGASKLKPGSEIPTTPSIDWIFNRQIIYIHIYIFVQISKVTTRAKTVRLGWGSKQPNIRCRVSFYNLHKGRFFHELFCSNFSIKYQNFEFWSKIQLIF